MSYLLEAVTSSRAISRSRNTHSKEYMHPYVNGSTIYNSQDLETALRDHQQMNGLKKKKKNLWCIYPMEYYAMIKNTHKKTEALSFGTTWMDLEIIMLSEISQSEKDKYRMISLTG